MSKIKLGDIANITKLAGFEHTKYIQGNCTHKKINSDDMPLFIGKTVRDGKIDTNFDWYISKDISNSLERSQLNKKCIVLPYVGTVGDLAIYDGSYPAHLGSNIAKIELNNNCGYTEEFIYYFLKSPYGQTVLLRDIQGAIQKNITMGAIRAVELPSISVDEQKKVVSSIKCIDDKIEINNKISVELESMAKTIYDYWFLQFEFPNEDGKPYKSSGGKMVWNEELKREIPEGWKCKTIKDIENNIITGKTPSSKVPEYYNGDIPFITIGDIRGNMYVVSTEQTLSEEGAKTQNNKFIPEGSICVTCIATPGLVGFSVKDSQTNQQINSIVPKNKKNSNYLYFAINEYFEYASGAKTGNTFANMNKEDFSNILLLYNKEMVEKYFDITKDIFDKIKQSLLENEELASLRDFLLPMLMNGQIGFKDGER